MEISRRGHSIPASPIRRLVPYAEAAKREGVHVHHLNIGQPDLPTPPGFWEALRSYPDPVLAYGHSAGLAEFRAGLARYYQRCGYDVEADDVTVTTGGSEAVLFAFLACCDAGDEVICFEPFYTNYNSFAVSAGVRLVPLTCVAEEGYHLPPLAEVEDRVGPRTRALIACTPNNPTGTVLGRAEMEALADLCRRRRLFFLSDEVYREFVYGERHTGVLELGLGDQAVMLDSISKRFSACGARVGCVVTKNRDLQRAFLHLGQARLCPPTLEQAAALAILDLGPDYYRGIQDEYRRRRDVVVDALERIPGVVCRRPMGAFYAMAKLPIDDAERFAIWLLEKFRHEGETVMVAPGDGFYATPGRGRDEVRIAYVLETGALARAMACLARGLEAFRGSPRPGS
jgi:aspartate aminotransferase